MSWKLAEWRWREQAHVRERSLWKIWDVEDAVKNGDVVEEAVRLAYHFPDQVDTYWRNCVEVPQGGRLGSIRSATNPHPPPRSDLPDIPPPHHTSYHPSRSSSAPLLASFENTSPPKGHSDSTSSSLSGLLTRSIGSTPSRESAPATPQLPKDFLDSRDWNHLVIDQKVDRTSAVNELRSSFGLLSKAARIPHSPQRDFFSPQYSSLGRANTYAESQLRRFARTNTRIHKRHKSTQDFDASFQSLQDRVVPWSNLDTVFEDQQYFTKHYFQHEGAVFEVLNPHNSFGEHPAVSPEASEEPSISYRSSHDSASLLIPKADMGPFTIGKSSVEDKKQSNNNRKDTPPARVFDDLPSAHSGIVGHSAESPPRIPQLQEMKNMTGAYKNLPPLIDLPRTPPCPGPASLAVLKQLADAKAMREPEQPQITPERPLTPLLPDTPNLRLPAAGRQGVSPVQANTEDDAAPVGDFISRRNQINTLRTALTHDNHLIRNNRVVRNSRSFSDLGRQYRQQPKRVVDSIGFRSRDGDTFTTSGTTDSVVDMSSRPRASSASNVLVRDSRDIIGIAISGDENYSHRAEHAFMASVPAPLRLNRRQVPAGEAPRAALPAPPGDTKPLQYQKTNNLSSEVAEYDDTQSLLNFGRYDPHASMAEDFKTQVLRSRREAGRVVLRDAGGHPANPLFPDVRHEYFHEADDLGYPLSRCGPPEPKHNLTGSSQIGKISGDVVVSATAPYHNALNSIYRAFENNNTVVSSPEPEIKGKRESAERDGKSSHLPENEDMSKVALRGCTEDAHGQDIREKEVISSCDLGRAKWFANEPKKENRINKEQAATQVSEDDGDWETVRGSELNSGLPSQSMLQPPSEPLPRATLATESSLADIFSIGSLSTSQVQPATPWDPIRTRTTRTHPALPHTPHKYRLRQDTSTGDPVWLPEYSLPEVGQHSSSSDPFKSAQATPDLPAGYPALVSKFSASTPRQQALGEDTSSEEHYSSSPPVFSQGRLKARMAAVAEEQELAQDCIVHELEGDQVHTVAGVADIPENRIVVIPQAESVYSLGSEGIVRDERVETGAVVGAHPAKVPGTRATITNSSFDDVSMRDGMQYGEKVGGIEMTTLGLGRGFYGGGEYLRNGSSAASLPFKTRLMSQGRFESDEDLAKRFSSLDDDGSYYGVDEDQNEDVASLSSIMREHDPGNQRTSTFSKRTVLGLKNNITGTLRGTGMRATGSSPANVSSDTYDPAMQRHHPYGQLSSGSEGGYEGNSDNIVSTAVDSSSLSGGRLTQEQVKELVQENGIDINAVEWGNVQGDITGVTFRSGYAIGAPRAFRLPRTLPPINSFDLSKEQPLREGAVTQEELAERIHMAMDDWDRLQSGCPKFPLRDSHLTMKFVESDPRRTGSNVCNRGGISRINGRIEEDAFCFEHDRREFSIFPALRGTPLSAELQRLRTKAGREVVWMCLGTPIFGWVLLYYIWKQQEDLPVANALMLWRTNKVVGEMGEEEIEFAGQALLWFSLGFTGVAFACLAVLLWAFL